MQSRVVVGCGQAGHALVERLDDRPGDLLVLETDGRRVERLRESGVSADEIDSVDVATIRAHAPDAETVVIAGDDPTVNLAAARAVRAAYSDAMVLAYTGTDAPRPIHEELQLLADRLIDPGTATTDFLDSRIGDEGLKLRQLRSAFWDVEGPLAIVTHDNPDPDAIASAIALERIAVSVGIDATVCYYGHVSHQENRAFINLLELDLRQLDPDEDLSAFGGVALVDHSRPGVNDQLPPDTPVDIVVDHHPPKAPIDANFVDVRSTVGATSTLMAEYLRAFGLSLDETVATALLFGIRIDTHDFRREVSAADFEAAAFVLPQADIGTLERIESPSMSADTLETIARAIRNREVRGSVLTSGVGPLSDRDALAQAADRLLTLQGVDATVVYGVKGGVVYVSGRARGIDLDLGETLREAFNQIGSAGGHADMAGAQIQLADTTLENPLGGPDDEREEGDAAPEPATEGSVANGEGGESVRVAEEAAAADGDDDPPILPTDLDTLITERFFEALEQRPRRETVGLYASSEYPETDTDW